MSKLFASQKNQKWIWLAAFFYFLVFILPNLTGAKNPTMLSVFEHDEFAQYPHVIRMLTPGDTAYQSLRNFVVYLHYYYGYPFYFFSAIALIPVKLIFGADWASHTQTIVLVLRQIINVLPMLYASVLLVRDQNSSKPLWKGLFLFFFLQTIPALVGNNLWWHPDSLLTLFSVLTILFLSFDNAHFGKYFYLSGIMCALAIGSKILGVLFVITYLSYLLYALFIRKATIKKVILSAILFLIVLVVSVVITNPLLLLPIERGEIIATFKANLGQSSQGFWIAGNGSQSTFTQICEILNQSYGGIVVFIAAILTTVFGLRKQESRLKNLVILTWVVGYMGYFVFFAATIRTHYFLPAILPLYSTLFDFLPNDISNLFSSSATNNKRETQKKWLIFLTALVILISLAFNLGKSISIIKEINNREETSPSIALYQKFETDYGARLPADQHFVVYRDWRAYVNEKSIWEVVYNWDLATYDYLDEIKPDILFIEKENALYFSDDDKIADALDPELMRRMNLFYSDVMNENVNGFHELIKDDFGWVFVSDSLYTEINQ